jgi:RimJ/RimL family protein N-acetyltransferase
MISLSTARLLLRPWRKEDEEVYYRINQNEQVLQFLAGPLTHEQVYSFITKQNKQLQEKGYTLWAVELKSTGEMIGFIGLNYVTMPVHFAPAVEIGWRLDSPFWGQGYATEGAKAALEHGFNQCHLDEIVAFTVPKNQRSRSVMERLGMKEDVTGGFDHPNLPADHPFSQHVLYRITRNESVDS